MGWFRVVMAQVLWVDAAWCGLDHSQNVYFYGNLSTASKFGKKGVIAIAGDVILKVVLKFMKINIEVTVLEFRIRERKVLWTFGKPWTWQWVYFPQEKRPSHTWGLAHQKQK